MDNENNFSRSISAGSAGRQYDSICKKLLSYKIILAWIMKECMTEYNNCTIDEIAEKYIEGAPLISEEAVQVR